jgi:NAD(P)-dependent dehydrogenase (short-subunit alcohol dehydrogenase family)
MNAIELQNLKTTLTEGAHGIGRAIAERLLTSEERVSLWAVVAAALIAWPRSEDCSFNTAVVLDLSAESTTY